MKTPRITRNNIYYHELIGLRVRIIRYSDPGLVNVEGVVIDETQKTLVIEVDDKRIRVFKSNGVFEFNLPSGESIVIKGDEIIGRPWDRLKRVLSAKR